MRPTPNRSRTGSGRSRSTRPRRRLTVTCLKSSARGQREGYDRFSDSQPRRRMPGIPVNPPTRTVPRGLRHARPLLLALLGLLVFAACAGVDEGEQGTTGAPVVEPVAGLTGATGERPA